MAAATHLSGAAPPGHLYVIALGSNRRHARYGAPRAVVRAAITALEELGEVVATSPVITTSPLGPSLRRFANAALVLETPLAPDALLARLKQVEHTFGRRRARRWGERVLDCDIILWSGGAYAGRDLTVPHPLFRQRDFVLRPLRAIAPHWRDPLTGLRVQHLHARLTSPRPLPR